MNGPEIVRRIYRELKFWQSAGAGQEVKWTVRGLKAALDIAYALAREERAKALERKPRLNHPIAGELFRAITAALLCLNRCERGRAIKILENARNIAMASCRVPRKIPIQWLKSNE